MMRLNADIFRCLYLEHGVRAQGFFLRMTGYDRELARDLTQDLFMRLWQNGTVTIPANRSEHGCLPLHTTF